MPMNEEKPQAESSYWLMQPLIFALLLALGFSLGVFFNGSSNVQIIKSDKSRSVSSGSMHKLGEILNFVQTKYVDSVDVDQLADVAARAILEELDPNSYYISREETSAVNQRMQGNMEGIGVEFFVFRDSLHIIDVFPGGPADNADIRTGDIILSVNDSLVTGMDRSLENIMTLMRSEPARPVRLELLRPSEEEINEIIVTRGTVPINSIGASYLIDDNLLYVKINSFTSRTYREFMESIETKISDSEEFDLILDLRHNPGGYLQEAVKILSQMFGQSGLELVKTRGYSSQERVYRTTGQQFFRVGKVAVLIDGASASASEIIAGVLQDLDRAIVIGTHSYGKGSVQEHYRLRDNSAIRLTVSRYYIPSGRSIYKKVEDDYYSSDVTDETFDVGKTFLTANGRKVFEGRAIEPDILIDQDSFLTKRSYSMFRNTINRLAFVYFRESLGTTEDITSKGSAVDIPVQWKEDFLELAEEEFGNRDIEEDLVNYSDRVKNLLMARIARYEHGPAGYYKQLNHNDPFVIMAKEALYSDYHYQAMLQK
ncbi:MAG: PDZ domain-containing protein [Saprospirales bacterium]|nr:MAG: PDZ domain-containing protein [Saprospirales bacterium]